MATVNGSALGFFKGKIGNTVAYQLNGKNVVRSLPSKSAKNKRGSKMQNENRSKFTRMQYFLQPILYFIRVGFNLEGRAKQMSAHNAAKSYNMLHAFNDDDNIDYSKVLVSYGNLTGAVDATVVKDDAGLHFSWRDNTESHVGRNADQVMLLAYCPEDRFVKMMLSGARRRAGQETLEIAERLEKNQIVHAWIAFISDDRQHISMSTYLGEIIF